MRLSLRASNRWRLRLVGLCAWLLISAGSAIIGHMAEGQVAVVSILAQQPPPAQQGCGQMAEITLTGQFVVLYGNPTTDYYLVNEQDTRQRTRVFVEEAIARAGGGIENLKEHRVTVTGVPSAATTAGGAPESIQASSIRLAADQN